MPDNTSTNRDDMVTIKVHEATRTALRNLSKRSNVQICKLVEQGVKLTKRRDQASTLKTLSGKFPRNPGNPNHKKTQLTKDKK